MSAFSKVCMKQWEGNAGHTRAHMRGACAPAGGAAPHVTLPPCATDAAVHASTPQAASVAVAALDAAEAGAAALDKAARLAQDVGMPTAL